MKFKNRKILLTLSYYCVNVNLVLKIMRKSKIKESTMKRFLTESHRLLEDDRKVLWEWVCEMQSEW